MTDQEKYHFEQSLATINVTLEEALATLTDCDRIYPMLLLAKELTSGLLSHVNGTDGQRHG